MTASVTPNETEIVIVGGGIAGAALATALARAGVATLVLEKSCVHEDRIRGEFLVPWGVVEAKELGVLDVLLAAGGHWITRSVPYAEGVVPDTARSRMIDMSGFVTGVPGAMTFGHPAACQALDDAATRAGASVLRGVERVEVTAGSPPSVTFTLNGAHHTLMPRLVVGADGRGSAVARAIGAEVRTDPLHHLVAGLLIEKATAWPDMEYVASTEGDVMFYVFPQGDGRVRLYLCYGLDQRNRFSGADGARRFLDAFRLSCLPDPEIFPSSCAAGPCRGYPNADVWIDVPAAPGVVLIGDAAGHNDPTIGQGLSIALRDAHLVRDAVCAAKAHEPKTFAPYIEERRERMRRLRFLARQFSTLRAEFGEAAQARRRRAAERIAADRSVALPLFAIYTGPSSAPAEFFAPEAWRPLLE